MAEPHLTKRMKLDEDETQYFASFLNETKNHKLIKKMKTSLGELGNGSSNLTMSFLRVTETNATGSTSFIYATCEVAKVIDETEGPVVVPIGFLFLDGYAVLDKFLNDADPKVPENVAERRALKDLLQFMSSDHAVFKETRQKVETESSMAVRLAEHLMMPLVPLKTYVIDSCYPDPQSENCCASQHQVHGKAGDTSFGCSRGWHGHADIIVMDKEVPFSNVDSRPGDCDVNSEHSDSSIEVESGQSWPPSYLKRMLAETIVFSFLQHKQSNGTSKHSLVPGIGIGYEKLVVHMYDSVKDVLLATCTLPLFLEKELHIRTVLVLWLVLNYKLFSSGIPDSFKKYSAKFHDELGPDFLEIYRTEVVRPSDIKSGERDDFPSLSNQYPIVKVKELMLPEKKMISVKKLLDSEQV